MSPEAVRKKCREAFAELERNIVYVFGYTEAPVLMEGSDYQGIWLECGPHEGLLYSQLTGDPSIALASHNVFFHHQRTDGQFPCWIRIDAIGYGQIQMVVPIAATALETARLAKDEAFLVRAYTACSRWDAWLRRHRNTRGTGLCEAFCEWDSGHDHSPRFAGQPLCCSGEDAAALPTSPVTRNGVAPAYKLPYLAPDLSATVYGGRMALAEMARELGRPASEQQQWLELAASIQNGIFQFCHDPETDFFYDRDADNRFVKIRGDLITRVFGEHVLPQKDFDRIYNRHLKNPNSFWTPYPLPSIAADDPAFVRSLHENSWGGASQALTAMRAPRWFSHYGKTADLKHLMHRWLEALVKDSGFRQQMNPWTGEFTQALAAYSPAMLAFTTFAERLFPELRSSSTL